MIPAIMELLDTKDAGLLVVDVTILLVTLVVIVGLQLPGLWLAQRRAMMIPPMRALREE